MSKGVMYIVCSSRRHFEETSNSIKSLLEYNPDTNVTVLTDMDCRPIEKINYIQFHSLLHHPLKEKCKMMRESLYDKTIFLDTDTRILGDISPIFGYLDNHDIAVANAPNVDRDKEYGTNKFFIDWKIPNIYNTGVLGFNNNDKVNKFFNVWWGRFKKISNSKISTGHGDQIYFNKILNDENIDTSFLNIKVMDNKRYNARAPLIPYIKQNGLMDEVVIYHGHKDLDNYD